VADSKSWREIRSELALNEAHVDTYRRLMAAQLQIAELLLRRGLVTEEQLDEALATAQVDDSGVEEGELNLSALARYVAVLGGHLEVRAVFREETVTVMRTNTTDATEPLAPPPDLSSGGQISGSDAS
jgi:hypothetical protein